MPESAGYMCRLHSDFLVPAKSLIALCTSSLSITARCRLDLFFTFPFAVVVKESPVEPSDGGAAWPVAGSTDASCAVMCEGTIIGVWRGGGGHCRHQVSVRPRGYF